MKIRHVYDVSSGREDEDRFEAFDDGEALIGTARVSTSVLKRLLPARPLSIAVHADADRSALDAILGAATARALKLAANHPDKRSRVHCECDPEDGYKIELLKALGYSDNDGLVRMARDLARGPIDGELPHGCTIVMDYLADDIECRYFLERYKAVFGRDRDMNWIKSLRALPHFARLLMVAPNGLAGEMLVWTKDGVGVVGVLQTTPKWQHQGVASYLLELARLHWLDHGVGVSQFDVWLRLRSAVKLAQKLNYRPVKMLLRYPGIDL